MNMTEQTKCPICESDNSFLYHTGGRNAVRLKNFSKQELANLRLYKCRICGTVWLANSNVDADKFYANSGMFDFENYSCEAIRKESEENTIRYFHETKELVKGKTVCDVGCGWGGYLLSIQDLVTDCVGVEIEKAAREALSKETNLHIYKSIDEIEKVDVITLFHVIGVIKEPLSFLLELKNHLNESGKIWIETPNADDALLSLYQSEDFANFTYWEGHYVYYTTESLKILANRSGLNVEFVKYKQRYPLSNHLYWLRMGSPGGHQKWSFLQNEELDRAYYHTLAELGATDTLIALLSKE